MQFWCSARGTAWTGEWQAYPGVWLFLALLVWAVYRWNGAGARRTGKQNPGLSPAFLGGVLLLWIALDWPLGPLGAGHLASAHMLQFLLMGTIAPPLLLRGLSPDALALLTTDSTAGRIVRRLTAPLLALILFNVAVLLTHIPAVVDSLMTTQLGSLLIDLIWISTGILFWWPVVVPVPARPRFPPPLRMGYLVLGLMFSPVMFGLVGFLVYSENPLYGVYELAPPLGWLSSREDHQLAGVLMSMGGAITAFIGLSVIFFRWSKESG